MGLAEQLQVKLLRAPVQLQTFSEVSFIIGQCPLGSV